MKASPFIIPIHELQRRQGASKEMRVTLPAPSDLRTAVIGVEEGSPLELDLRIEATGDGIYVSGTVGAHLTGECVRCLDPLERDLEFEIAELYLLPETVLRAEEDGDEEAQEMLRTDGDTLDVEEAIRDTLVMDLPFSPVCREDCPGLCPDCGIRLAAAEPGHSHSKIDPRFAALEGLLQEASDDEVVE